uniref:CCHC-type domain-containing protein n=1 Tax=Paramormyrops kingsleyae TaxID=1676925 RepID=A0A3B3T6K2_9TELE
DVMTHLSFLCSLQGVWPNGGYLHPPAYFSIGPNRGYLFYTGQPTFCRSCQGHGHKAEDCPDLKCRNCLEPGHMAKDCKGPQRCRHCSSEEHLARVCPQRSYAGVLAGGGQVRMCLTLFGAAVGGGMFLTSLSSLTACSSPRSVHVWWLP